MGERTSSCLAAFVAGEEIELERRPEELSTDIAEVTDVFVDTVGEVALEPAVVVKAGQHCYNRTQRLDPMEGLPSVQMARNSSRAVKEHSLEERSSEEVAVVWVGR